MNITIDCEDYYGEGGEEGYIRDTIEHNKFLEEHCNFMSADEAIKRLKEHFSIYSDDKLTPNLNSAVEMAIVALNENKKNRSANN